LSSAFALPNTKSARCAPTITDTCPPTAPLSMPIFSTMRCNRVLVERPIGASADHASAVPNSKAKTTPVMRAVALAPQVGVGRGFSAAATL
jgi:hypothetical protein